MKKTFSVSTNTSTEYIIDGVKYRSLDEVPANVRANYEHVFKDADGNGIPDILETQGTGRSSVKTHNKYIINGVEYESLESMPADVRRMYEMLVTDRDKNGIPDIHTSGIVKMSSIDTDMIEGAMNELSGKSSPVRNKGFWGIVILILFIVVFNLS